MRFGLVMVLLASALTSPARAEGCGDKDKQQEMNLCYAQEFKAADRELNRKYGHLIKGYGSFPELKSALVKAQRAWVIFRDAECDVTRASTRGGSVGPSIVGSCLAGLTRGRIKDIELLLTCEEGDLSCTPPHWPKP